MHLQAEANELTHGQVGEANEFTCGHEHVYMLRRTSLHAVANALALYLASERYCTYRNLENYIGLVCVEGLP